MRTIIVQGVIVSITNPIFMHFEGQTLENYHWCATGFIHPIRVSTLVVY